MSDFFYTWTKQRYMVPMSVQRTYGTDFILDDGSRVFDFISTSFQAAFGHSNKAIIRSISKQMRQMSIASPKSSFELKTRVSRRLIEFTGMHDGRIFYTVSGAEAVENAIKMARRISGKPVILARQRSYHGASLGAMSVSGDWRSDDHFNVATGTVRIPEPCSDPDASGARAVVSDVGADKIAALIVETVSGTNGVIIPPESWFAGLRKICDEFGILLILDEVLAGFYRCGTPFAFQGFDAKPDMICMSKAITGGYIPFGAVWVNEKTAAYYDEQVLSGGLTNYAHPLGLAATSAVLDQLNDDSFLLHIDQLGQLFSLGIRSLATKHSASATRVRGLLAAIEFGDRQLPAWSDWVAAGVYLYTKGNMMILAPPLVTSPEKLNDAFNCVDSVLQSLEVRGLV